MTHSILPWLSKLLESHVHQSLYLYLNKFNLLYSFQSGFRPGHSCQAALTYFVNQCYTAINNNNWSGIIFLDLSKAFDLINHSLLIDKLKLYNFDSSAINWFTSYLKDRKQFVSFKNCNSSMLSIKSGVPQGSILGPLLFLLYINDLHLEVEHCHTNTYADDSTLLFSSPDISIVNQTINDDLSKVHTWCNQNHMIINTNKSKAMVIPPKKNLSLPTSFSVIYNNASLSFSEVEKSLGLIIDSTLSWTSHCQHLHAKVSSNLAALRHIAKYLDVSTKKLFYFSYIQPFFDTCCNIWSHASKGDIDKLYKWSTDNLMHFNNDSLKT